MIFMKRAKIMLAVITLFAVIGGALAFKAKNFGGGDPHLFAYTSSNTIATFTAIGQPGCFKPVPLIGYTTAGGNNQYNGYTTTFLTNDEDFCTTLIKQQNDE